MLVYLCDLRHKTITLTPDAMPLGIGFLAAYASKVMGSDLQVKLFAYPEHLIEALKHTRPDVLGMSNYCWNYALHCRMLRYAKGLYPDILTVMGGPNISLDPEGEEHRIRQTPCLDVYVLNEGEPALASLLTRYHDAGLQKSRLLREALPSAVFVDPKSGEMVRGALVARLRQLDEIPSPYLTGLMDPFFDGAFSPMIQTNRGCPFSCTFCVEGIGYMTKVNKVSSGRVREELRYIAERTGVGQALQISDSNFGMFAGDQETARAILELQQQKGWPKFVVATTGKNNKEAILSVLEVLAGSMMMTNSVQSMDATVLANIKRSNIKLGTYAAVQQEVRARNLQSYTEVIVGLPGETKESLFRGCCELLDSGTHHITLYQLMLLEGTELNQKAQRQQHGFKTQFRSLARNFGLYAGEPVFELEEIVVSTNTLSFDDYLECRKLQLILEIYHREELFKELLEYLKQNGVPVSAFIMALLEHLHEAPEEVQQLFGDYVSEAKNELFASREEALKSLNTNYERLASQEMGGNLLQKYSALGWFRVLGPILLYGIQRAATLVMKQGARSFDDVDRELQTIRQYLLSMIINILDIDNQLQDMIVPLEYDIEGWKASGYRRLLSEFQRLSWMADSGTKRNAETYTFHIPQAHASYLKDKLRDCNASLQAVGKQLTRLALRDLRRQVKVMQKGS
jgi:radical SAM superfamily enzyme YgiQ (UPF0313 family)